VAELAGFDGFYVASYRRIVGQVFALLGDLHEAEDVTQDAFAKASLHWGRIAAYDQPEAWVRRVAFNQAYNRTRRTRRWLAAMAPPRAAAQRAGGVGRSPGPAPGARAVGPWPP
jgi:RNA polymerase sigma-70 factor, ECF subfamily